MPAEVTLSIRRAVEGDCALIWEWANDPETRANSFTSELIPWEIHQAWFARVLADPERALYVVLANSVVPIAQARFDRIGEGEAEVSVSLAPAKREQGLGAPVIRIATEHAVRQSHFTRVHAYIKPENSSSARAFARAGYVEFARTERKGFAVRHFTYGKVGPGDRPDR